MPEMPGVRAARRLRALFRAWLPRRFMRSAGIRFGAIYALVFVLSTLVLAAFLWWSTAGLLDRQTDTAINADTQGLAERYAEGGVPALITTIEQRLAGNVDDDAIYLLADPSLKYLAGNLERWPISGASESEWYELAIRRAGIPGIARVHYFMLPGGFHLLVGRDVEVRVQMARLLTDALLWAAGAAVVLGVAGSLAVRGLFRATLRDVSATATAISAGDLSRRVPIKGRGDEFDRLAETINDMLDRIGRLMDGVRHVSNAIAHDLRTPIARARARLEDAAVHANGETELRAAIDRAQADLDGIIGIFQALLRIVEIEAGSRRSAFAAFNLAPVLTDMVELYEPVAESRGQELRGWISGQLPVYGDRDMIQQAVANLLDNALKFSPPGGRIEITAEVSRESGVSEVATVTVADEGAGMSEADRARATERFFRAESARSTPGSGLGLALVQAVASLHGGSLRLHDNAPGLRAALHLPAIPARGAPGERVFIGDPAQGTEPSRIMTS